MYYEKQKMLLTIQNTPFGTVWFKMRSKESQLHCENYYIHIPFIFLIQNVLDIIHIISNIHISTEKYLYSSDYANSLEHIYTK